MDMRKVFLFCVCFGVAGARAQTAAGTPGQTSADSVKAVINALFDAMRRSDSAGISGCFSTGALLQTAIERGEGVHIQTDSISVFAHIISSLPVGAADERPRLDVVKADGPLATVWAPYRFIYKGTLHHCGVDSFQLVRINGIWKIQYILDTEHKYGCPD